MLKSLLLFIANVGQKKYIRILSVFFSSFFLRFSRLLKEMTSGAKMNMLNEYMNENKEKKKEKIR